MRIDFATRSSFLPAIHAALDDAGGCEGRVVVQLSPQGYPGTIRLELTEGTSDSFATDWEGADPTRFPARIRAAATALRDRRCFGVFVVSHDEGRLTIDRVRSG